MAINIEKNIVVNSDHLLSKVKSLVSAYPQINYDEDCKDFVDFVLSKVEANKDINVEYTIIKNDEEFSVYFKLIFETNKEIKEEELPKDVTYSYKDNKVTLTSKINLNKEEEMEIPEIDKKNLSLLFNNLRKEVIKANDKVSLTNQAINNLRLNNIELFNKRDLIVEPLTLLYKEIKGVDEDDFNIDDKYMDNNRIIDALTKRLDDLKLSVDEFYNEYNNFIIEHPYIIESEKEDSKFKYNAKKILNESKNPLLFMTIGAGLAVGAGAIWNALKK